MNKANIISVSNFSLGRIIIIGLMLLIFLTGCGDAAAPPPPTTQPTEAATEAPTEAVPTQGQGEGLILLYFQAPTTANPHLSPGTKDLSASRIAYEPLASFDKDGNLVPFLAAEIPSVENGGVAEDGTSVIGNSGTMSSGRTERLSLLLMSYSPINMPLTRMSKQPQPWPMLMLKMSK